MCYNLKCSGWKLLNFWCLFNPRIPSYLPTGEKRGNIPSHVLGSAFFFSRRLWNLRMIVTSYNHPTEDISHRLYMFSYMFWCFFFLRLFFCISPPPQKVKTRESQKWYCTGTNSILRAGKLLSTLKDATFEVTINQ